MSSRPRRARWFSPSLRVLPPSFIDAGVRDRLDVNLNASQELPPRVRKTRTGVSSSLSSSNLRKDWRCVPDFSIIQIRKRIKCMIYTWRATWRRENRNEKKKIEIFYSTFLDGTFLLPTRILWTLSFIFRRIFAVFLFATFSDLFRRNRAIDIRFACQERRRL